MRKNQFEVHLINKSPPHIKFHPNWLRTVWDNLRCVMQKFFCFLAHLWPTIPTHHSCLYQERPALLGTRNQGLNTSKTDPDSVNYTQHKFHQLRHTHKHIHKEAQDNCSLSHTCTHTHTGVILVTDADSKYKQMDCVSVILPSYVRRRRWARRTAT